MTTNPPTDPNRHLSPQAQAQLAELLQLEARFPPPTWEEVKPDWVWLYANSGTAEMEPYLGQAIAVYEGKIVGADPHDATALRVRLAKQYQRHPERFVITYYG